MDASFNVHQGAKYSVVSDKWLCIESSIVMLTSK